MVHVFAFGGKLCLYTAISGRKGLIPRFARLRGQFATTFVRHVVAVLFLGDRNRGKIAWLTTTEQHKSGTVNLTFTARWWDPQKNVLDVYLSIFKWTNRMYFTMNTLISEIKIRIKCLIGNKTWKKITEWYFFKLSSCYLLNQFEQDAFLCITIYFLTCLWLRTQGILKYVFTHLWRFYRKEKQGKPTHRGPLTFPFEKYRVSLLSQIVIGLSMMWPWPPQISVCSDPQRRFVSGIPLRPMRKCDSLRDTL